MPVNASGIGRFEVFNSWFSKNRFIGKSIGTFASMRSQYYHSKIVAHGETPDYTCLVLAPMEYTNSPDMTPPDYNGALEYAHKRLIRELLPILRYHNLHHTFAEVLPAATLLAGRVGVIECDIQLLQVAAAFHDIGWIVRGEGHEYIGVEICKQFLPTVGFSGVQINRISGMIMATRLPQSPQNELEELLADADMFTLGSDDFWPRNADLRYETVALGDVVSDKEWYQSQLEFLQIHQYHTAVAQDERDLRKKAIISELHLYVAQDGRLNGPTANHP
jgi:uncharacterized protein